MYTEKPTAELQSFYRLQHIDFDNILEFPVSMLNRIRDLVVFTHSNNNIQRAYGIFQFEKDIFYLWTQNIIFIVTPIAHYEHYSRYIFLRRV